jgi:hypothetical protein
MSNLLEVYDLMEWTDPQAAKTFWAAAKEGKIDEDSFEAAYRDELVKLKLWYDLMYRGVLKDKSSYGKIKKAAEENPDSWAVKALLKLWVLQFKDNAKSVRKEREEAEAAEKAKKEKELKELSEKYFPVVETKVKEIIAKVVYPAYDSINATFEEAQNKAEKIKDLSRGLADLTWIKNWNPTNKLTKENCVQYKLELNRYYSSNELYIRFTLLNFFDKKDTSLWKLLEGIQFNTENSSTRVINSGFVFPLSEIDEGKAYEILTTCFELLAEAIQKDTTRVDTVNRAYENLVYKTEGAKKAKAAVNAGKPVDPDFIAKLLADIRKGKENAEDEYKFWSDSTDGSAGAAHHMALFRAAEEIAPYLFDCHWRSYIDTKQIAEWKPSDSDEQLKDALITTVFSYRPNLNIEILKD